MYNYQLGVTYLRISLHLYGFPEKGRQLKKGLQLSEQTVDRRQLGYLLSAVAEIDTDVVTKGRHRVHVPHHCLKRTELRGGGGVQLFVLYGLCEVGEMLL